MAYLKPGVYTKEIDISSFVRLDVPIDFPELVAEMAEAISSLVVSKHKYVPIEESLVKFFALDVKCSALVRFCDGYAVVSDVVEDSFVVQYTDEDAMKKIANKIDEMINEGASDNHRLLTSIIGKQFPVSLTVRSKWRPHGVALITSQEELERHFGSLEKIEEHFENVNGGTPGGAVSL